MNRPIRSQARPGLGPAGSLRIIGGVWRGRRIATPPGLDTRPTLDSVREALFNIITADVHGAVFLDAYAGSGAVGLEALSRGAARVVFIEQNPMALRVLRQNIALLGAGDRSEIIAGDAAELTDLFRSRNLTPDLIFADPPYAGNAADLFLNAVVQAVHQAVVSPSRGIIIQMEVGWAALSVGTVALDFVKSKRYGRTELSFWNPPQPDDV